MEKATKKAELVLLAPEEALDFLMENGSTKKQYMSIELEDKRKNCDIYPSYKQIIGAKDKCRPKGLIYYKICCVCLIKELDKPHSRAYYAVTKRRVKFL